MQLITNKLINIARSLKSKKQDNRAFHVAGIFRKNRLISFGFNQRKTHPFAQRSGYPFPKDGTHAECLAIAKGRQDSYNGCTLVVLRIDNNDKLNNSRPCKFCQKLIDRMGFKTIIYSDGNGEFIKI